MCPRLCRLGKYIRQVKTRQKNAGGRAAPGSLRSQTENAPLHAIMKPFSTGREGAGPASVPPFSGFGLTMCSPPWNHLWILGTQEMRKVHLVLNHSRLFSRPHPP